MKTTSGWPKALVLAIVVSALTAGCMRGTRPAQFYAVSPMTATASGQGAGDRSGPAIIVGPLTLPEALRRPQIVTRIGVNRLEISEFHRWAGPLEGDMLRVVAENLSLLLGTDRVAVYPLDAGFEPAFRVTVDIRRLDASIGKEAALHAAWTVWSGPRGQGGMTGGNTVRTEPLDKDGYDALVAAYSRLLETLSREIAAVIAKR